MTKTQLAMVSGWMPNGSINQFVKERQDVNRFKLVSPPSKLLQSLSVSDNYMAPAVE